MSESSLQAIIEQHRAEVMRIQGVVGIGVGLSRTDARKRCIQVYVTTNDWPDGVPHQLDGYDVELVKTAGFRAT